MTLRESRKCKKCGIEIKPVKNKQNVWVIKDYCNNCLPNEELHYLICQKCKKQFLMNKNRLERKFCPDCSSMNQDEKEVICKKCGKIFLVGRTNDGKHFKHQYVCDDCGKPAETKEVICERCGKTFKVGKYPGTNSFKKQRFCSDECRLSITKKFSICECCGKKFELQRTIDGHFIPRQYCSDVCRLKIQRQKLEACHEERLNKIKQTCQEKYGVDYPCLTENCINSNPNIISKINLQFANLLNKHHIDYELEFALKYYHYDFHILNTNILVEINPTFTHTNIDTGVYEKRDKTYHYNKTKIALNNNYICICVWDWDNWEDIIKLIKQKDIKLKETNIQLHYSKGKENIISNNEEDILLLEQGYLPIYDDGFQVIT